MAELPVESSSDAISWVRINSPENHFSGVDFDFFSTDLQDFNFSDLPPTNISPPSVPLEDITSAVFATTSPPLNDLLSPPLNDLLYQFREIYRNSLQSSPSSFGKLEVFWSHDDSHPIKQKVRCAFGSLQVDDSFGGLIQFWALVQTDGRKFLTTSSQPFTLATLDKSLDKYLSCSLGCEYNVDVMDNLRVKDEPTILSSYAAPARAFLNQKPELVPDLRFHLTNPNPNPLVSSALMCGLMHSVLLPIFDPSQSDCVGVVECSMRSPKEVLQVFNKLNTALEKEDLRTFDARKLLPYNTIQGLGPAKDEIDEALKTVWHSHHLVFAHVWIGYEDGRAKQIWGLKLTNSSENLGNEDFVWHQKHLEDYNNACYRLPLKMDEVLAGKIFEKYEPHFIKNILNLGDNKPKRLFSICLDYSCFVIYLRSNKTDDLDYVFQFLWSQSRNNVIMLESLLLTLKRCLPSFKFDYGAEFGDEIDIVDVENFTESEIKYLKIFQRNKISLKRGRQLEDGNCSTHSKGKGKTTPKGFSQSQIESLFGQTRKDAAKELGTSVSTLQKYCNRLGLKWPRKGYSKESQSDANEEDEGGAIQRNIGETPLEGNILKIKVEYAGDVIMVILPISSTFADIEKEIGKKLKLDPAVRYKLDYLDNENEWILLACDEDLKVCTNISRKVRLRLLSRHPS